jgi:hypothetical protein
MIAFECCIAGMNYKPERSVKALVDQIDFPNERNPV